MCVVSCHVEGWSRHVVSCHVAFCHVLSCPCGGPQTACVRKLLLPKDHVSHTARTVIRLRTARPPHIFSSSRCFKKKTPRLSLRRDSADPEGSNEQRAGARSTQADVRVYHHKTAVWAVRVLVLPVKKNLLHLLGKDRTKRNTWEGPPLRQITERRLKKQFKRRVKPWSQQGVSGSPEGN